MARLNSRRLITLVLVVTATTLAYLLYYYWTPVPTQLSGSFLGGAENDTRTIFVQREENGHPEPPDERDN